MWYSVLKEVAKLKIHVMCYNKCWFTKNCLYEILGTFVVFGTNVLSIFNYKNKKRPVSEIASFPGNKNY